MSSSLIFISYYTPDYSEVAARLEDSLREHKLTYALRSLPPFSCWIEAVRFKPMFIQQMMCEHCDKDAVVWVDADARVLRPPTLLFNLDCDLGVHFFKRRERTPEELLSGTMYIKNSGKMRETVLPRWIKELQRSDKKLRAPEQTVLSRMLPTLDIKVHRLPYEYCHIFDTVHWLRKGEKITPVIEHYQESRRIRKTVGLFGEKAK